MILYTDDLDIESLDQKTADAVYNCFDVACTHEIAESLIPRTGSTYDAERRILRTCLGMTFRGIKVDDAARQHATYMANKTRRLVEAYLTKLCWAAVGCGINTRSPKQVMHVLYDLFKFPPQKVLIKGEWRVSSSRPALEKLLNYYYAQPVVRAILALRDLDETIETLRRGIDPDGRLRASFNPAGTVTQRLSSTKNPFNTGGNLQNITNALRNIFIADDGYVLAYIDYEQAESRAVAFLSGDQAYIDACNSGDLHTYCCRLIWPDLPWTGSIEKDRALADEIFYRHFSRRDLSKRGGHASNYGATAATVARHLKIEQKMSMDFQNSYFSVFKGIRSWQHEVAETIQRYGRITTPYGFTRIFFDRKNDMETVKSAIAFVPQHIVGRMLCEAMCEIDETIHEAQLLANIHDALLFQYPQGRDDILYEAKRIMQSQRLTLGGRVLTIPTSVKIGLNWRDLVKPGSQLKPNKDIWDYAL